MQSDDGFTKKPRKLNMFVNKSSNPERVIQNSVCSVLDYCGSCPNLILSYNQQLNVKTKKVKEFIDSIDLKFKSFHVKNCEPSENKLSYRHVSKLSIERIFKNSKEWIQVGYYRQNLGKVLDIGDCPVQTPRMNTVFKSISGFIKKLEIPVPIAHENSKNCLEHIIIRTNENEKSILIIFGIYKLDNVIPFKNLARELRERFNEISGILIEEIDKGSQDFMVLSGHDYIEDVFEDFTFYYSVKTQYFVNPDIYYKILLNMRELSNLNYQEDLLHINSGAGFFPILLSKTAQYVYGLETLKSEYDDSIKSIELNKIKNVKIFHGNLTSSYEKYKNIKSKNTDVIIYSVMKHDDSDKILQIISECQPKKLFIVSPVLEKLSTLLRQLEKQQFTLKLCIPYDSLPGTNNFETIFFLESHSQI